nr:hypothetical protein [Saccharopolyspora sp. HNM0983]
MTTRWLLLHVLFLVATIATGFFTVWQWDRAHEAGGSFQNLGYALQWPLFGAFTIFLWIRMIRMDMHADTPSAEGVEPSPAQDADNPAPDHRGGRRVNRPLVPPPAPPVDSDEDPDLAAYNRYLAGLDAAEDRSGS